MSCHPPSLHVRRDLVTSWSAVFLLLLLGLPALRAEESLPLAGKWRFSRDEAKAGLTAKWYEGELKAVGDGPSEISLPGTTDEAKAGLPNPKQPSLYELYRPNVYTGPAWYQREIEIPSTWKGKQVTLFLERNHWVTHVWLDKKDLGTRDSLISPQVYDLGLDVTPGNHRLTICVDNTLPFNLGKFVSINYEGTQTNWNGLVGAIELRAADAVALNDVEIYPEVDRKLIKVEAHIRNVSGGPTSGDVQFSINDEAGAAVGIPVSAPFSASSEDTVITTEIPMGDHPKLWDEFSPNLYVLKASLASKGSEYHSEKSVSFGMRKLAIQGTQFTMNGRPLFLRGTLECAIFPLTGYPPTDVASWRRIYQIEKSYGLNFIRFHSWCPPDAAFAAADQEGIMIQVEGPQANVDAGENTARDNFMAQELMRIIHTYGNHPSFCLMTLGNEYEGSDALLSHWVDMLIHGDPRHFYSAPSGASWQNVANRQWSETGRGRGVHGPDTMSDASAALAGNDRPNVGHEIGQWTFYPHFDEIKKYTGVLEAKNFELVRDDLQAKGMLDEAPQFFQATGHQAVLLYKEEIENLLRTPGYAGFSLLDLHDYPGQGTALIGLLDPFWDSKGFITPEEHTRYFGATVPLLRFSKRTYTTGEMFEADAEISHFGPADLSQAEPEWKITDEKGGTVASGEFPKVDLPTGKLSQIGKISTPLSNAAAPAKLTVTVSLRGTAFSNSWNIWVYAAGAPPAAPAHVLVTDTWNDAAKTALSNGQKVLLFPAQTNPARTLRGSFLPVFWSPVWFKRSPGTMGILCDPRHPAFSLFPTDSYSNWQWWDLINHSRTIDLSDTPQSFRPIIQVIDNFSRQKKLGNLFEARVGKGRLLVCTIDLHNKLAGTPAGVQLLRSLYAYVGSDTFQPASELTIPVLDDLFNSPPSQLVTMGAKVIACDSEAPGYSAANAIDGNMDTIWHTVWTPTPAPLPHDLTIDMGVDVQVKGVTYLARQDVGNGRAKECEVFLSEDPSQWNSRPAATVQLKDTDERQTIMLKVPVSGRYLKFIVKTVYGKAPIAAVAELDILK